MLFPFVLVGRYSGTIFFRRCAGMTTTEKVTIKHTHRQQRFVLFVISLRILFSRAGPMTDRAMGTRTDAFGPNRRARGGIPIHDGKQR
jgi:hypothetical protein